MDRNALLASTRAEFMQSFFYAFDELLPRARNDLFAAADTSFSGPRQRQSLEAFKLLNDRHLELRRRLVRSLDQLLNRSFQTAYSTFRPSFSATFAGETALSLVDTNQYEDQLYINSVTRRFHLAAEEQLRDLNTRIAILFEQNSLNERENPFRPFLCVRAIATAIDNMGERTDYNQILFERLTADIEPAMDTIYGTLNRHLSEHGIAAQLQLKIIKTASAKSVPNANIDDLNSRVVTRTTSELLEAATALSAFLDDDTRTISSDVPKRRVEQLFDMVRRVSRPGQSDIKNGHGSSPEFTQASDQVGQDSAASANSDKKFSPNIGAANDDRPHTRGDNATQSVHAANDWQGASGIAQTLKQLFSSASVRSPSSTDAQSFYTQIRQPISSRLGASIGALVAEGIPSAAQMVLDEGGIRNLIFEQRSTLSESSGDSNEQMTIDVVAMLFEFILRDAQIPAEVRAQLGRLQFLVLKVALRESALLTQKNHPARLLVNRIGTISVGLQQIDPSGARIATKITRIVETLLADGSESSDLFNKMLDEFDAFIALELRARDSNVDAAAQAVENAESRILLFARLTAQLYDVLGGLRIDPFLHEFLTGTWLHVIERAESQAGTVLRRFRQFVPDLLWSLVPKNTAEERNQLIALLPVIVGTVRRGLMLADWDESRQRELLDWLVAAHSLSLRSPVTGATDLALSAMYKHFDAFLINAQEDDLPIASSDTMSALQDQYLAEALDQSAVAIELLDPLVQMVDTLPMQYSDESDHEQQAPSKQELALDEADAFNRLRQGVAINITLGTEPLLATLCWKSASTFVLTLAGQNTPSMISLRMFSRLFAMRRVTFVESAPIFERAVQSLLTLADELDEQTP